MIFSLFVLFSLTLAALVYGFRVVPQQQVWVVQRLGRYHRKLEAGPHWIIPLIDVVAYRHSLKEEAIEVPEQTAITQDNVSVTFDGIVYVKVIDPVAASYGAKQPLYALTQLVQTTMRSEIGKIPLDKTFEERESLNAQIVDAINQASEAWGILCLRYEIKDIKMPEDIRKAMELQMTAERHKRAEILKSEGKMQAQINEAEGNRQRVVLESEATRIEKVNRAQGEAEAIRIVSEANSLGLTRVGEALQTDRGADAASLQVAEKYLAAFEKLAQEGTTLMIPSNLQEPAAMISQAMAIFGKLKKREPSERV